MNIPALRLYLNEQAPLPFRLGVVDCVTFVCGAVLAGWGRDFRFHLHYDDRRSAVDQLRAAGGLEQSITTALGPLRPIAELKRGDVIWFDEPRTLGLLMDEYVAVKANCEIHRIALLPQYMGWKT